MDKRRYPLLDENIWHTVLENGLHIYVDQKPGYNKQFAFFAFPPEVGPSPSKPKIPSHIWYNCLSLYCSKKAPYKSLIASPNCNGLLALACHEDLSSP